MHRVNTSLPGKPQSALLQGALLPLAAWAAGMAVFTVLGIQNALGGEHPIFVVGRVTAYVASAVTAALIVGMAALFGLGCGALLRWLDEPLSARAVARAVGAGFWVVGGYVWLGVALLIVEPPAAFSLAALVGEAQEFEAALRNTLAYKWMSRIRYPVGAAFLVVVAWRLARAAKPLNAVVAVAFGAAAMMALLAGLGALGGNAASQWDF